MSPRPASDGGRLCEEPGCTGIHRITGHKRSELCPAARRKASARAKRYKRQRRARDPEFARKEQERLELHASRRRAPEGVPTDLRCVYPDCPYPREGELDLCARMHGASWPPGGGKHDPERFVENDGIVDWLAVDIAANGERFVRLTWVERDLAMARIFGAGLDAQAVEERMGYPVNRTNRRYRRLITLGKKHYGQRADDAA